MPTVLIVENDPIAAMDVQTVLNQAGHTVVGTAPTYDRAIQIAAASRPDIALVDYHLGSTRDGVLVGHYLRRRGIKVIYITGYADEVRLVDAAAEIVPKPYLPETLLRVVEQVIASANEG